MNGRRTAPFTSLAPAALAALALTLCGELVALGAGEEAAPVLAPILVVAPTGSEATAARITAELGALGVRVIAMMWPGEPPAVEGLAELVQATGASAALRIVRGGGSLEVWIAGSPAGTIALAETLVVTAGTIDRGAALAVRAAETLRARLLLGGAAPEGTGDGVIPGVDLVGDAGADRSLSPLPLPEDPPPALPASAPGRAAAAPEAGVATGRVAARLRRPYAIGSVAPAVFVDALDGVARAVPLLATRVAVLFTRYTAVTVSVLAPTVPVPMETATGPRRLSVLAVQTGIRGVFSPLGDGLSLTVELGGLYFRKREAIIATDGGFRYVAGWSARSGVGFYGSAGFAYRFHRYFALYADAALTMLAFPPGETAFGWMGVLATGGVAFTL